MAHPPVLPALLEPPLEPEAELAPVTAALTLDPDEATDELPVEAPPELVPPAVELATVARVDGEPVDDELPDEELAREPPLTAALLAEARVDAAVERVEGPVEAPMEPARLDEDAPEVPFAPPLEDRERDEDEDDDEPGPEDRVERAELLALADASVGLEVDELVAPLEDAPPAPDPAEATAEERVCSEPLEPNDPELTEVELTAVDLDAAVAVVVEPHWHAPYPAPSWVQTWKPLHPLGPPQEMDCPGAHACPPDDVLVDDPDLLDEHPAVRSATTNPALRVRIMAFLLESNSGRA